MVFLLFFLKRGSDWHDLIIIIGNWSSIITAQINLNLIDLVSYGQFFFALDICFHLELDEFDGTNASQSNKVCWYINYVLQRNTNCNECSLIISVCRKSNTSMCRKSKTPVVFPCKEFISQVHIKDISPFYINIPTAELIHQNIIIWSPKECTHSQSNLEIPKSLHNFTERHSVDANGNQICFTDPSYTVICRFYWIVFQIQIFCIFSVFIFLYKTWFVSKGSILYIAVSYSQVFIVIVYQSTHQ